MAEDKTVYERLCEIQAELKVPKNQYNSFGKYQYRSKEDILEAAKPLCHERGLIPICDDEPMCMDNGWVYMVSSASVVDIKTAERVSARGYAREQYEKKGMDASQITGCVSSYAGKRALGNLFAIDDAADADGVTPEDSVVTFPCVMRCTTCGKEYVFESQEQVAAVKCCDRPDYKFVRKQ